MTIQIEVVTERCFVVSKTMHNDLFEVCSIPADDIDEGVMCVTLVGKQRFLNRPGQLQLPVEDFNLAIRR